MSVCLYLCLCVFLSVWAHLACDSLPTTFCWSFCLSISLFVCQSVSLSVCLPYIFVLLSVWFLACDVHSHRLLPAFLSVYLSAFIAYIFLSIYVPLSSSLCSSVSMICTVLGVELCVESPTGGPGRGLYAHINFRFNLFWSRGSQLFILVFPSQLQYRVRTIK